MGSEDINDHFECGGPGMKTNFWNGLVLRSGERVAIVTLGFDDRLTVEACAGSDIAEDLTDTDESVAAGAYVFSDVIAGPSKAEPEDLAVTFTVDWSTDEYPGVHMCRFLAYAEDGSIVGEFAQYSEWNPGRWYRDLPGDPRDAATGEVRCEAERLDDPGIADVDPISQAGDVSLDEVMKERRQRLADWAAMFDVEGMSEQTLAANLWAVWRAVPEAEGPGETWQLTDRMHYLCVRLPEGHEFRGGEFCA